MAEQKPTRRGSRFIDLTDQPFGQRNQKHGMKANKKSDPVYEAWHSMKQRCYNPRCKSFPRYGGRGITVCQRWMKSFLNFLNDMGPKPTPYHSIERKDNNGPYAPDNCVWAHRITQANNRRDNIPLTLNGITQNLSSWAICLNIPDGTLRSRLKAGWSVERTLITPRNPRYHLLTFQGKTQSIRAWEREMNMKPMTIRDRLNRGWSIERALIQPIQRAIHIAKL